MTIKYFLLAVAVVISIKGLVEARHLNERNYPSFTNLQSTLLKTATKIKNSERLSVDEIIECLETHTEKIVPVYAKAKEAMRKCFSNEELDKIVTELFDSANFDYELWTIYFVEAKKCNDDYECINRAEEKLYDDYIKQKSEYIELKEKSAEIIQTLPAGNQQCIEKTLDNLREAGMPIYDETERCIFSRYGHKC